MTVSSHPGENTVVQRVVRFNPCLEGNIAVGGEVKVRIGHGHGVLVGRAAAQAGAHARAHIRRQRTTAAGTGELTEARPYSSTTEPTEKSGAPTQTTERFARLGMCAAGLLNSAREQSARRCSNAFTMTRALVTT